MSLDLRCPYVSEERTSGIREKPTLTQGLQGGEKRGIIIVLTIPFFHLSPFDLVRTGLILITAVVKVLALLPCSSFGLVCSACKTGA